MKNRIFYLTLLDAIGKYDKIITLFEKGRLNNNHPKVIEIVAKAYIKEGLHNHIDEYLFKAKYIIGESIYKVEKNKKKLLKLYKKSDYIFEESVTPQKKMELKAQLLIEKNTKSSKPWVILSSNYDVSEDPNSAIHFLKNAVWKNSKCIVAYYKLGYIYENNLNKIDASIYYYKKAVLLQPGDDKFEGVQENARYIQLACKQLAMIMYNQSKYKPAMLLLEKAIPLSSIAGYESHELIRELIQTGIKSSDKLGLKAKFINKLHNKYNISPELLGTMTFV
jgi:tetratricopeptide (TPR) repeat protein